MGFMELGIEKQPHDGITAGSQLRREGSVASRFEAAHAADECPRQTRRIILVQRSEQIIHRCVWMQTDDTRLMNLMASIDDVEAMAALSQRLDHDKLILEHGHVEVAFELRRSRLRVQDPQRLLHTERCM